jgi:hypothetical protein
MSRDLSKATPRVRQFAERLMAEAKRILGIDVFVVEVDRSFDVQVAYFAQGRDTLTSVNSLRKRAGLNSITEKENKRKITWTMKSKHVVNLSNEETSDDFSRAVDFGIKDKKGNYHGETKADINNDGKLDYVQIGIIGKTVDQEMVWGGDWKNKDLPHWEEPD